MSALRRAAGEGTSMNGWGDRIATRSAVVGVIGQGYVGLPLALVFLHERITRRISLGTVMSVLGIWLVLWR